MRIPLGAILWRGPSKIDRAPIVAIVTGLRGQSKNPKTGRMAQLWILRDGVNPIQALETGDDRSICGDCPHRGLGDNVRTCYVDLRAPNSIYKKFSAGKYPVADPRELPAWLNSQRLPLRLGAYGEPAALPVPILRAMMKGVPRWTGYTHQWTKCHNAYRRWLMASTDSVVETRHAWKNGWRTYRVRPIGAELIPGEIDCPASHLSGERLQCADCAICNGTGPRDTASRVSVSIEAHGKSAKRIVTID